MYADDGNYFTSSTDLQTLKDIFEEVGSPINESKSGWVKKDGKWLKP
jgi:hypothetical protein